MFVSFAEEVMDVKEKRLAEETRWLAEETR